MTFLLPNAPVITDVSKMKEVQFQFPLLLEGGSNLHLLLLYQPGNLRAWELTVSPGQRMMQTEVGDRQMGEKIFNFPYAGDCPKS